MFIKSSNKTAIIYNDSEISYNKLLTNIDNYAKKIDINEGDMAAIVAQSSARWIYSFYAIWQKGGISVPLDVMAPCEEIAFMIDDCTPKVIFTSNHDKHIVEEALKIAKHQPVVFNFDEVEEVEAAEQLSITEITPKNLNDTAVIIYTSGTTGAPKGVMLSYNNIKSNIEAVGSLPGKAKKEIIFHADMRVLAILPFHHILPLQGTVIAPIYVGGTTCIVNQLTTDAIVAAFKKYKITLLIGVPRLYESIHAGLMAKIKRNPIAKILFGLSKMFKSYKFAKTVFKQIQEGFGGHLEFLVSGGAKLADGIGENLHALGLRILEGYGMSETAPMISYNRKYAYKYGTVGFIVDGVDVRIENEEILVKGPNVMKGYYNRPEETAEIIKDGWLHTGDKGTIDKKGYLRITGRIKEIIVLPNGKNINPVEIETKLEKEYPIIKEIGIIEQKGNLFAVIYPDFDYIRANNIVNIKETLKWDIIDKYNLKAATYKRILNFEVVEEPLPKTRIGKLKRFELINTLNHTKVKRAPKEEPTFKEYEILNNILSSITNRPVISTDHIELDLGLDSLDKLELQEQVEKNFGIVLENEILADHSTVINLAKYIEKTKTKITEEKTDWAQIIRERIDFKLSGKNFMMKLLIFLVKPISKLYFRLEVKGLKNIPKTPVIFAPNHQSALDGLLLSMLLKSRTRNKTFYIAKDKNFDTKFKSYFAKHSNILLMNINKNIKTTIQNVASLLSRGKNVVIFPEGARSRDGKMGNFKKTFAILSKEMNIPVIPVAIKGAYQAMSIGNRIPKPKKITVTFLDPINPEGMEYEELTTLIRTKIEENLNTPPKKRKKENKNG